ncbi:hypothetical protein ScalyP_jg6219 [Parmales sp. scaly parma]|nr:hypothetical protein ScalyP_jg6219 [Parmales sp. scaly parma]
MDLEMQTLKDQNSKARDMIKDAKKSAKQMERDAKEARKRDKEEAEKGLLEGWRAFRDEKSGKFYYTIMATGQWTWVKPVVENNTVTETTVVGVDDGQSAELRDQFNACNEIQNVLRLTPKDISSTPFRILLQQHLPKHFIELMERRDKEAVRKREDLKAKKERGAAKKKQELKGKRDEEAARKKQELAIIEAEIEADRLNTEAKKMAEEAESRAKRLRSKWLRFGYSLHKKEAIRETWVLALEFHELCISRRPTAPPEMIISRSLSALWTKTTTSRKTKEFLEKELVGSSGHLTYYVNQRLGESNQDVFRGYESSLDKIENTERNTPCAIKKIRASEVASVGELEVMMKALEVKCVNVLELHAVVKTREYVYLAVELCEGCLGRGDFFDTFKLSISERLGLCWQIVVGVTHLHTLGVWHRDIKPGNVLFKQAAG